MASKSQITGQSDIWDLSDYFPPGEPWESSFNWYKNQYALTSKPYPYYENDTYGVVSARIDSFTVKDLSPMYEDPPYSFVPVINSISVRNQTQTYAYEESPYKFTPIIDSIQIRNTLQLYSYEEFYKFTTPSIESIVINQAIMYSYEEKYKFTPSIDGVTVA